MIFLVRLSLQDSTLSSQCVREREREREREMELNQTYMCVLLFWPLNRLPHHHSLAHLSLFSSYFFASTCCPFLYTITSPLSLSFFLSLFLKMDNSRPLLLFIFGLFKQTLQFLQQYMGKNVHPVSGTGIRTHNLLNVSLLP